VSGPTVLEPIAKQPNRIKKYNGMENTKVG
jgi:hypothetical protein